MKATSNTRRLIIHLDILPFGSVLDSFNNLSTNKSAAEDLRFKCCWLGIRAGELTMVYSFKQHYRCGQNVKKILLNWKKTKPSNLFLFLLNKTFLFLKSCKNIVHQFEEKIKSYCCPAVLDLHDGFSLRLHLILIAFMWYKMCDSLVTGRWLQGLNYT